MPESVFLSRREVSVSIRGALAPRRERAWGFPGWGGGSVAAGDLKEKHARTCVFGGCCSLAELVEKVPVLWRLGCSEVPQWCLQRWATRKSLAASKSFVGNKASLVSFGV